MVYSFVSQIGLCFFMMTADVFREFHKIRVGNFTLTFYLRPKVCTL